MCQKSAGGKALLLFTEAVASLRKQWSESKSSGGTVRDVVDEDAMRGMELVMHAWRLCFPYCNGIEKAT